MSGVWLGMNVRTDSKKTFVEKILTNVLQIC